MRRSVRFSNTTGPCNPDMHYMLPPKERLIGALLPLMPHTPRSSL